MLNRTDDLNSTDDTSDDEVSHFNNVKENKTNGNESIISNLCLIDENENTLTSTDIQMLNTEDSEYDSLNEPALYLSRLKAKNADRLIIGHININFLQNKFEPLKTLVQDKINILVVSETKSDDSFPTSQFLIDGYTEPDRLDRNSHGGGLLIYVRDDISSKKIKTENFCNEVEGIFIEIRVRKIRWLIMGGNNPNKECISYFLSHVSRELDKLLANYENFLILGDFNSVTSDKSMRDFCEMYDLINLINEAICYKNPHNPSSIDVILTNKKEFF